MFESPLTNGFLCAIISFVKETTAKGGEQMDKLRLEYELKRNGKSNEDVCAILGISRTTFYRKMNGESEFTLVELQRIAEIIGTETMTEIFFAKKVS